MTSIYQTYVRVNRVRKHMFYFYKSDKSSLYIVWNIFLTFLGLTYRFLIVITRVPLLGAKKTHGLLCYRSIRLYSIALTVCLFLLLLPPYLHLITPENIWEFLSALLPVMLSAPVLIFLLKFSLL